MFYLNFWHKYNYNDHIMNTMRFLHEVVGYSRGTLGLNLFLKYFMTVMAKYHAVVALYSCS